MMPSINKRIPNSLFAAKASKGPKPSSYKAFAHTQVRGPSYATVDHDVEYSADDLEFMRAMDTYKREKSRPFPTMCEVLGVLVSLGYSKG